MDDDKELAEIGWTHGLTDQQIADKIRADLIAWQEDGYRGAKGRGDVDRIRASTALMRLLDEAAAREKRLREAGIALANAADDVGVRHFDTDSLPLSVAKMQDATTAMRAALDPEVKPDPLPAICKCGACLWKFDGFGRRCGVCGAS